MSTRHRALSTATMRPITRSPIDGWYRVRSGVMDRSLLVRVSGPGSVARIVWPAAEAARSSVVLLGMNVPCPRIHCGSVVIRSPGTRIEVCESLGLLAARGWLLGGESGGSESVDGEGEGLRELDGDESEGGRIVIAISLVSVLSMLRFGTLL